MKQWGGDGEALARLRVDVDLVGVRGKRAVGVGERRQHRRGDQLRVEGVLVWGCVSERESTQKLGPPHSETNIMMLCELPGLAGGKRRQSARMDGKTRWRDSIRRDANRRIFE